MKPCWQYFVNILKQHLWLALACHLSSYLEHVVAICITEVAGPYLSGHVPEREVRKEIRPKR